VLNEYQDLLERYLLWKSFQPTPYSGSLNDKKGMCRRNRKMLGYCEDRDCSIMAAHKNQFSK
jgi:hypothetical protein